MVKLLKVKKIENRLFEVIFLKDQKELVFLIKTIPHKVESIEEPMDLLVPETNEQEFSDIWGQSFELRQEVGKKIRALKHQPILEPETA